MKLYLFVPTWKLSKFLYICDVTSELREVHGALSEPRNASPWRTSLENYWKASLFTEFIYIFINCHFPQIEIYLRYFQIQKLISVADQLTHDTRILQSVKEIASCLDDTIELYNITLSCRGWGEFVMKLIKD